MTSVNENPGRRKRPHRPVTAVIERSSLPVEPVASSTWPIVVAFILPLSQLVQFNLVGNLYLHDLLAPALLILLITTRWSPGLLRPTKMALILVATWLLGAIITDLYRETPFDDLARGWTRIVLFGINIAMLWMLSRGNFKVLSAYSVSYGVALCLGSYLYPARTFFEDPWKFGEGLGVTITIVALAQFDFVRRRGGDYFAAFLIGTLALFSLWLNSRSLFAMFTLASSYVLFSVWVSKRPDINRKITPAVFVGLILGGLAFTQVITAGYETAADAGWLGEVARQKYLDQTAGDTNLLLGGRPELAVQVQAIIDDPIIGHGSWAQDAYYTKIYFDNLVKLNLPVPRDFADFVGDTQFRIPTHSHLLGSWTEAGILGALIWFWTIGLVFRALYAILKTARSANALVALVAMQTLWDVPFSPFGTDARIFKALEICLLLAAIMQSKYIAKSAATPRPVPVRAKAQTLGGRLRPVGRPTPSTLR